LGGVNAAQNTLFFFFSPFPPREGGRGDG